MRFLCLHGAGTSAERGPPHHYLVSLLYPNQFLAPIIHALQPDGHEFEFVEGEFECEAAEGVAAAYPDIATFYQYWDALRPSTVSEAVTQVHALLAEEEPPFDGVIAFSQGAMLAATVLIDQARRQQLEQQQSHLHEQRREEGAHRGERMLKCAMLLNSPLPFDTLHSRRLSLEDSPSLFPLSVVRIPTFHAFGRGDRLYYAESVATTRVCEASVRTTYDHGGGHEIPSMRTEVCEALVQGLRRCVVLAGAR